MNLEVLYEKMNHPAQLGAGELPALKELCEKYPYAQLFSILYLKALSQAKDLSFDDELKKHAYKITDRTKLYDLLQTADTSLPIESSTQPLEIEAAQVESPVDEVQELTSIVEEEPKEAEIIPTADKIEEAVQEQSAPEVANVPTEKLQIDELEKEILSSVIANAYSLELEEQQADEDAKSEEVKEVKKVDLSENRSFTSWLQLSSDSEASEDNTKKEVSQIIEKFIQHEPERIKPKAEFYSAPKKAKESIDEDKLIYTETLANIFALQGNFPKAITAFQQLMLTIPEKKLYFAKKIEELNKKINP